MAWTSLLTGDTAARARAVARDIVTALRDPAQWPRVGPTLANGDAGIALLHTYAAQISGDADDGRAAEDYIERAVDGVAEHALGPGLFIGFTGVAWANQHLQHALFGGYDGDDPNAAVDAALRDALAVDAWTGDYELVRGLAGILAFAAAHCDPDAGVALARPALDHLAALAVDRDGGVTWWTPASLLVPSQAARFPRGHINLGLAHGVPGVVGALARAHRAGVGGPRALELLHGAVAWLLTATRPDDGGSTYAYFAGDDATGNACRSAWCYGDPGVAAALLLAADAAGEPRWRERAVAIAERDARRPVDDTYVVDAGVCHGAAGLGHLYNRMHQATGSPALGDAARAWFERALAMREPDAGVAGYRALLPSEPGAAPDWQDTPGYLNGAAGIALCLMAATADIEPAWDMPLLIGV